jgi:MFS family permease
VTMLASGLFHLLDSRTSFVVFAVVLALFGAGNGMVLTGVNAATQAIASPADRAMAAGVYSFMRSLGMAIGVAVGLVRVEDRSVG